MMMKSFLIAGILGLAGAAGAAAQDVHKYRNDGPRHEARGEVHRRSGFLSFFHRHRDHTERVWVPARYESRITGYDHCGKPLYAQVCINAGYWTTRPVCE